MIINLPNLISASRLVFLYNILLLLPQYQFNKYKIILIYLLGVSTDALDGYVARKFNMQTEFGKFFDGFIDYIFCSILIIYLFKYKFINKLLFAPFLVIIIRDTIRNLLRLGNLKKKVVVEELHHNVGNIVELFKIL